MKKSIIFGTLTVIIISFATTFYFQHQAFSEQKATMKSNFAKQQKKSNQQIKDLQNKNAELEKTIKTSEEKLNTLQSELDSVKTEKEQTVAASQENAEIPVEQITDNITPGIQQEEPVTKSENNIPKDEKTNPFDVLKERLGREPNSDEIREYINNN
ncbi:MAG: hypothetical protein RR936_08255 [Carnobacterium sp.]|uniref:hypothetical protein n=1 Tax=Carnobacterium sp. TaxID=48221 RepID=UPI002FC92879